VRESPAEVGGDWKEVELPGMMVCRIKDYEGMRFRIPLSVIFSLLLLLSSRGIVTALNVLNTDT
jgi:hypothetical protein